MFSRTSRRRGLAGAYWVPGVVARTVLEEAKRQQVALLEARPVAFEEVPPASEDFVGGGRKIRTRRLLPRKREGRVSLPPGA